MQKLVRCRTAITLWAALGPLHQTGVLVFAHTDRQSSTLAGWQREPLRRRLPFQRGLDMRRAAFGVVDDRFRVRCSSMWARTRASNSWDVNGLVT
jgi:hypothetical protein